MLHVIGLGVAGQVQLIETARQALAGSAAIIGSPRQLQTLAHEPALRDLSDVTQHVLPPLTQLEALLAEYQGRDVCLLASGDPLYYGIGRWLLQRYLPETLRFYPAISSIQAACHALGLALQDVQVVSLHGRPLATLRRHLARHQLILCLTDAHSSPVALAQLCCETGFAESRLWLCERLGYADQQLRAFNVATLAGQHDLKVDPLHISVLEARESRSERSYLPAGPGIADEDFVTGSADGGGLLTKREVRMAILGLLPSHPEAVYWDIGAGCGGVAVEWALLQPKARFYAIEQHEQRLDCLQQNRERFGVVDNLTVVGQRAPGCLAELPDPQAVFMGGSDGELDQLLALCWQRLPVGGVLVASAVTEQSRACLLNFAGGLTLPESALETLQIAVSKGSKLAGQWVYRPKLPVTLFRLRKEAPLEPGQSGQGRVNQLPACGTR